MSSGEVKKVSREDIQQVQNLIERCLQLYMNEKEVMETLFTQAKISPTFTELVWQKLEEENREFFMAYRARLTVKHQITIFNKLLERQVELMRSMCPVGGASLPMPNESHSSVHHQAPYFVPEHAVSVSRGESIQSTIGCSSRFLNVGPSTHDNMQSINDMKMDVIPPNMQSCQNSHMGMIHGVVVKSEPLGYVDSSAFTFGADGNVLGMPPTIDDPSFDSVETNSQDASSYGGILGQIPRNFSFSDLTADFSLSMDILENYSRSAFLGTDMTELLSSPGRECQGEDKRLDTISEGLSYGEFSSD